jgi:opacity protein-like surface antigen
VGRLPLNDTFTAFAKVGLQYSRSDAGGVRDTGFGETVGVGMDISLTRQVAAVLQYDRAAVHFATGRDRVNLASVGLKYRY